LFLGRNRPASARNRAMHLRRLHTNVCSVLYAPSSQIILYSSRAAEVPGMLPHANAWRPTRKCAAHGFVSRVCAFGQCRKTTAHASACPSSLRKLSIRSAISSDRSALPLSKLDNVGREIFRDEVSSLAPAVAAVFRDHPSRACVLPRNARP
jgi:hypothetical protein